MGKQDFVQVDECIAIPVSSDLVVQQRTVTVTAKRPSGQGAEAVPVIFSIAPCPSEDLPLPNDAGLDGSALDEEDAGADEGAQDSEPICGGPFRELSTDQDHLAGFGLVILDNERCKGKSSSKVECVLDRTGSIAIAVQNTRPADSLGVRPPAPLCVAMRDFSQGERPPGTAIGWRYYQAYIATSNVSAFNTLRVEMEPGEPSRMCFDGPCDRRRVIARRVIGITGSDVSSTGVFSLAQYLQLQTSVTAKLEVTSQGPGSAATLSLSESCEGEASSTLEIPLHRGERFRRFYVCADHFGGSHVGTAVFEGYEDLATSWVDEPEPAVQQLRENGDGTVAVVDCNGERPLLGSEVETITNPNADVFFATDRAIDLDEVTCLSQPDEDAGTAPATPTAMPCGGPLELSLTSGPRCVISRSEP